MVSFYLMGLVSLFLGTLQTSAESNLRRSGKQLAAPYPWRRNGRPDARSGPVSSRQGSAISENLAADLREFFHSFWEKF